MDCADNPCPDGYVSAAINGIEGSVCVYNTNVPCAKPLTGMDYYTYINGVESSMCGDLTVPSVSKCPDGYSLVTGSDGTWACLENPFTCGINQQTKITTAVSVYGGIKATETCSCLPGSFPDGNGNCLLPDGSCPNNQIKQGSTCTCPTGMVMDTGGVCSLPPSCPTGTMATSFGCETCAAMGLVAGSNGVCSCPTGMTPIDPNDITKGCNAVINTNPGITCSNNEVVVNGACTCPSPFITTINGSCEVKRDVYRESRV